MLQRYFADLRKFYSEEAIRAAEQASTGVVRRLSTCLQGGTLTVSYSRKKFRKSHSKTEVVSPPPLRKPVINKEERHRQIEDHLHKAKQNQAFTAQLRKDRQERELKERLRHEALIKKLLAHKNQEEEDEQQTLQYLNDQRQTRLEATRQRSRLRKAELIQKKELGDKLYKETVQTVPLFKRIEEQYKYNVQIPELERKKAELAKKRTLNKPPSIETIREHAKRHDQLISQVQSRHHRSVQEQSIESRLYLNSIPKSKYHLKVLQEEKELSHAKHEKEEERKKLVDKMKHYSKLVKEVFQPAVDPLKQQESQQNLLPKVPNQHTLSQSSASPYIPKRTWKKNTMIPDPVPKPQPKVVDYLQQRRQFREQNPRTQPEVDYQRELEGIQDEETRVEKLKGLVWQVEEQTRLKERQLGQFSVNNLKGLRQAEKVGDVIIDSIKAKLQLLSSFQENNAL